jgi:hypothetical protein
MSWRGPGSERVMADVRGSPFEGFEAELDHESVHGETVRLQLSGIDERHVPHEPDSRRFIMYLGLFSELVDAWRSRAGLDPREHAADLWSLLGRLQAIEGPLRFALYERSDEADRQDLMSNARGREVAVTEQWMVPKLRQEIALYAARAEALRRATADRGNGGAA